MILQVAQYTAYHADIAGESRKARDALRADPIHRRHDADFLAAMVYGERVHFDDAIGTVADMVDVASLGQGAKLPNDAQTLDAMAAALSASDRYRVLRKLAPRPPITPPEDSKSRRGLFLDVETTGLDPTRDEIIELAMVPFTYGPDGTIFAVHEAFEKFREATKPIPPEITALTGITDAMVAGQIIDPAEVKEFAAGASLVIAHNAAFDRRFVERLSDVFVAKPWACSMSQVDWAAEGFEGTKLAYLVMGAGFFYDRHRAVHDCHAALELLATNLPISGVPAMARLLERARRPSCRIWAENAPYDFKDLLKARGYRWNGEANGKPRAWYIDVDAEVRGPELTYLRKEIYQREVDLLVRDITAYERFSERF